MVPGVKHGTCRPPVMFELRGTTALGWVTCQFDNEQDANEV
jgi:hypothetical protein